MEAMMVKHDKFGWDRLDAPLRKMIRMDWMDALQDYPLDEVRAACRQHTIEQPRKVPNEGDIKAIILRNRAKVVAALPKPVEPAKPRATAEQRARADEIIRAAGLKLTRANPIGETA
ncbi:hypothetical protein A3734_06540 [Sulfitobacter sp. HI0054]|nr:hypothetical protein A3734_06540 [Sulfitobacter sp. HI0054]